MKRSSVLAVVVAASLSVGTTTLGAIEAGAASAAPSAGTSSSAPASEHGAAERAIHALAASARRFATPALKASSDLVIAHATNPTSADVSDPVGDELPDLDARGDLIDEGIATNTTAMAVGAFTDEFDDPSTSTNWSGFDTGIVWGLDVNGDGTPDYNIAIATIPGDGVLAGVFDQSGNNELCGADPSWDATDNGYFVEFLRSCVDSPAKVSAQGFIDYITPTTESQDITAWTAVVSPAAPKPPPVKKQAPKNGYWMLGSDGHVYGFGGAVAFAGRVAGAEAMAPRADGSGYWVVDKAGHVFSYGSAHFYGGTPALSAGEFVSTISATPTGAGYWLFTNRGRAFPYGNASSFGDMSGTRLNGPIVASVATPTGHGYYMVGSDGGIFSFGDARFHGSTGAIHLNKPIVGISPTPGSGGYWLVASDGGVFAFGAPFRGSMGGATLNKPVDGLVAFGNGYLMAASDGGIFDFSNKPFEGSLAENPPTAPIIGLAAFST